MGFSDQVMESTKTINTLFIVGFLGIIWLIIYGNLSGNLGFTQDSLSFGNETIQLNDSGGTPATAQNRVDGSLTDVVITNASTGEIVESGNYTIVGVVITVATDDGYNNTDVNVSATVFFDSVIDVEAESVITNMTSGATTFYGFAPLWFTILAIVLLVLILVGLLAVVMKVSKLGTTKGGGFSG